MATGILKEKPPPSDRSMATKLLRINYKNTVQLTQTIDQGLTVNQLVAVKIAVIPRV